MTLKELQWHHFYMKIAEMYAEKSKDKKTKVGCVIVSANFEKILSVGYNGWAKNQRDTSDDEHAGFSGAVHAETNCIAKFDLKLLYKSCFLYTTYSPCVVCARLIVNIDCVSKVIYRNEYRDLSGLEVLKKANICVIKI